MSETGDVRQVIETEAPGRVNAAPELKVAGERWSWQECDDMLGDITAILDEHALNGSTHLHMLRWKIRALTSQLAAPEVKPCGMCGGTGLAKPITQAEKDEADRVMENIRQRLTQDRYQPRFAMNPAPEVKDAQRLVCPVCEEGAHIKADGRCWCGRKAVPAGASPSEPANAPPERVRPVAGPDAKDAIPPSSSQVEAKRLLGLLATKGFTCDCGLGPDDIDEVVAFLKQIAEDALTPGPEGATAEETASFEEIIARGRGMVMRFVRELADEPCSYGDNCPDFGTRHGRCLHCKARRALEADASLVKEERDG
jgi:hypothetical protein